MSAREHLLHVRFDEGRGPVIVLLHGINADAEDWRVVIDTIGPSYRCIAVDLLGFGESPKPSDLEYSADDHTESLDATLSGLGVDEPFLLVGYSLGGDIAIRYASTYPRKVRRLFLLSAPFYLPSGAYASRGFSADYAQAMLYQTLWNWIAKGRDSETFAYQIATGKAEEFAAGFLRTDDVPTHWDIMGKNLRNTIGAATFVDDLPRLDMPVTFALGIKDPIVRPDQTPALKRIKPDLEVRRIVGLSADHFMLMNLPETVAEEILRDEIGSLHVTFDIGSGDPVILLHGIETTSELWRALAEGLALGHRVIALDLLGFGSSPKPRALRYDLSDHVAAVLHTMHALLGERPARLVGQGLGGLIAMGCAVTDPGSVSEVVAFSPTLVEPGSDVLDRAGDPRVARVLLTREIFAEMASEERASLIAERLEEQVLAGVRTLDNAILGTDAPALLRRLSVPTRIVVAADEANTPLDVVREAGLGNPAIDLAESGGETLLALAQPAAALRLVAPSASTAALERADGARRVARGTTTRLLDAVSSAENVALSRGMLAFAGGLLLLLLPLLVPDPESRTGLLRLVFGGWILAEGLTTLVGAVGLKRAQKGSVLFFALAAAMLAMSWFVISRPTLGLLVIALYVFGRALLVGASSIWVVRTVRDPALPPWLLWLQGLLGIAIAALVFLEPTVGGRLLRLTLAGYLMTSGGMGVAFALAAKRRALARMREMLSR